MGRIAITSPLPLSNISFPFRFRCYSLPCTLHHRQHRRQRRHRDSRLPAHEKQSFIAKARRAQIIDAAIATLDEIGYVNTSLAQIAKRAGISTALISYHFKDKNDLMDHTLMTLLHDEASYVMERT
ncbi:TetR family transcriptional regulator [Paenibacillus thermoaerophilus]|uniref:TetR family transcriptional regulator n=1 Tax=Paenibacillus thermoaerophilus TaxID=1215385 RepID=A0ABW2V0F4_9BACL|nr:TetR family transcriptional regulator [Paenibacillus thermoaerophilus]